MNIKIKIEHAIGAIVLVAIFVGIGFWYGAQHVVAPENIQNANSDCIQEGREIFTLPLTPGSKNKPQECCAGLKYITHDSGDGHELADAGYCTKCGDGICKEPENKFNCFKDCNNTVAIANPASVYCEQNGGKVEIVTAADGSQSGNCIFADGSKCEEWAYFKGECGSNFLKKLKNIEFDGCGKIEKYKNELFYQQFTQNFDRIGMDIKLISDACLSLDKKVFIVITEGDYCTAGKIYMYYEPANSLVAATFNDKGRGCVSWPIEFGKRAGNVIDLTGGGGDAGCSNLMSYEYDIYKNSIELKKECGICEGEKKESCTYYR